MPTPTLLGNAEGSGGTCVTGTLSPSANSLILVVAGENDNDLASPVVTGVVSGFTVDSWAQSFQKIASVENFPGMAVWYARTGASPGTGTVTVSFTTGTRTMVTVLEFTDSEVKAGDPVAQSNHKESSATSDNVVLSSAPASTSVVFGVAVSRNPQTANTATPGSQFTELADFDTAGATDGGLQVQYDETSPGDTSDWSGMVAVNKLLVVFEVAASVAAPAGGVTHNLSPDVQKTADWTLSPRQ